MLDKMTLGFDGYIPKASPISPRPHLSYGHEVSTRRSVRYVSRKTQAFQAIPGVMQYVLTARGVFKETTTIRVPRIFGVSNCHARRGSEKIHPRIAEKISKDIFTGIGCFRATSLYSRTCRKRNLHMSVLQIGIALKQSSHPRHQQSFPMPFEGQHLDFRVEAFRALNHPSSALLDLHGAAGF